MKARIGQGFDAHRLEAGIPLRLGGVHIEYERGLAGHSDGDVLLHAVADALLGACGQGDLGAHFPSSDPALAGADSAVLLARCVAKVREAGLCLGNLDAVVIAEAPRLAKHQPAMRKRIADLLDAKEAEVNIKVTSSDGLGAIGAGKGIAALATVLLVEAPPGANESTRNNGANQNTYSDDKNDSDKSHNAEHSNYVGSDRAAKAAPRAGGSRT